MDPEERKIAALIAAFDTEHERMRRAIADLNQTGAQLQTEVRGAARGAVEAALKNLDQEIKSAAQMLEGLQRFSLWRAAWHHLVVAIVAIVVTLIAVWWYVPSVTEMSQLRGERDQLQASIEGLAKRGAKIQLKTCGPENRVCVLIDPLAGKFGDARGEKVYMIAKGY